MARPFGIRHNSKPTLGEIQGLSFRKHPRHYKCTSHWIFAEGGGLISQDISNYNKHATLTNGAHWSSGQFGHAIELDGVNDVINLGAFNEVEGVDEFSISLWVKSIDGTSNNQYIASIWGSGTDTFRIFWPSTENINFDVIGDDLTTYKGTMIDGIIDTKWHHIVGVKRAGSVHVYVDGVEGGTSEVMTVPTAASSSDLLLGALNITGSAAFGGKIDEVRIYNKGLTEEEIISLYEHPFLEFEDAARIQQRKKFFFPGAAVAGTTLTPSAIASLEAIGTAQLNPTINITGISSLENFGSPSVGGANTLTPTGISSLEAFGTHQINLALNITGVSSSETFGSLQLNPTLLLTGISSLENFGTLQLSPILLLTGITSLENFGAAQLNLSVLPSSISSLEIFGGPIINSILLPTGITSLEAFGTLQINVILNLTGISSLETFGSASVGTGTTLLATAISSLENFGTLQLSPTILSSGISSLEAFGSSAINVIIKPIGVVTEETFGGLVVGIEVTPTGITSLESVSSPQINTIVLLDVNGIASLEDFGTSQLNIILFPTGTTTSEAFGTPAMITGAVLGGVFIVEAIEFVADGAEEGDIIIDGAEAGDISSDSSNEGEIV